MATRPDGHRRHRRWITGHAVTHSPAESIDLSAKPTESVGVCDNDALADISACMRTLLVRARARAQACAQTRVVTVFAHGAMVMRGAILTPYERIEPSPTTTPCAGTRRSEPSIAAIGALCRTRIS